MQEPILWSFCCMNKGLILMRQEGVQQYNPDGLKGAILVMTTSAFKFPKYNTPCAPVLCTEAIS